MHFATRLRLILAPSGSAFSVAIMSKPVVLVTCATSANGTEAAKQLLATHSFSVRLGARDPTKLSVFSAQGADAVLLYTTSESADAAFKGVHAAYFILPSLVNDVEILLFDNYLRAAKQEGVQHIVYLSAIDAEDGSISVHHHNKFEQQLVKSGIPYTFLRPTNYHENVVRYESASIKKKRVLASSAASGVYSSVSIHDVAAVAVLALSEPSKHTGKIYVLTTEIGTDPQLAMKLSKAISEEVRHVNMTPEDYLALLNQYASATQGGDPRYASAVVNHFDRDKRESRWNVVDPTLEKLLGRKGVSLDQIIAENLSAFK